MKLRAEQEAAKERLRQQEMESKRMRSRFEEKKALPKYQEMLSRRSTLPAYQMKSEILEAIAKHSVVVISGDTGKHFALFWPSLVDNKNKFNLFCYVLLNFRVLRVITGCGKTTQVPQLVLDDLIEKGKGAECNIIVTQPRRISAISVRNEIYYVVLPFAYVSNRQISDKLYITIFILPRYLSGLRKKEWNRSASQLVITSGLVLLHFIFYFQVLIQQV